MSKLHWIIILLLIAVSNISAIVHTKYIRNVNIKVVDLANVLDSYRIDLMEKYKQQQISPETAETLHKEYMDRVLKNIAREKGIILIKQAVLGGQYEDITEDIKNVAK